MPVPREASVPRVLKELEEHPAWTVVLARNVSVEQPYSSQPETGFGPIDSVWVFCSVDLVRGPRNATLNVKIEHAATTAGPWTTLGNFDFTASGMTGGGGTNRALLTQPSDAIRVTATPSTGARWTLTSVTAISAWVDTGGAGNSLPAGGTSGQVLGKQTAADYDVTWLNPVPGPQGPMGPQGPPGTLADLPPRLAATTTNVPANDANAAIEAGWYYIHSSAANGPSGDFYALQVLNTVDSNQIEQIAYHYASNTIYYRRRHNGNWQSWIQIWPVNYSQLVGSVPNTALPGRLAASVTQGAPSNDLNQIVEAGWYFYANTTLNTPVPGNFGYVQAYAWPGTLTLREVAYEHGTNAVYTRVGTGGWVRTYPIDDVGLPTRLSPQANMGTGVTDWNTVLASGWYIGLSAANAPKTGWMQGLVSSVSTDLHTTQELWEFDQPMPQRHWRRARVNGTWSAWELIWPVPSGGSVGTTPPATPSDGQLFGLVVDAAKGIVWQFRYNAGSASPYKWEFTGGPSLTSEIASNETTNSGSYAALSTPGPALALPRAGDYEISIGATVARWVSSATEGWMSYDVGGTAAADADAIQLATPDADAASIFRTRTKTGLGAVTLTAKYRSVTGDSIAFRDRYLAVRPIRIS